MKVITEQNDESDKIRIEYDFKTFEENFQIVTIGMILSGVYPKNKHKKILQTYSTLVKMSMILITAITMYSCCVALKQSDMPDFVRQMPIFVTAQFTLIKLIVFSIKEDQVDKLITSINNVYRRVKDHPEWENKYIKEGIAKGKRGPLIWLVIGMTTMLSLVMTPLIQSNKVNLEKNYRAKIVIHDVSLPFLDGHKYEFPLFELMYMYIIVNLVITASSFVAIDGFFFVLAIHNETQLKILNKKVLNLFTDLKESEPLLVKFRIKNIVCHYLEIVRFHNEIQDLMSVFFANLFFVNSIQLCVNVFQIMESIKTNEMRPHDMVLGAEALIREYLPCSHGSIMSELSESIAEAVYFSNWYENMDLSYMRSIRILMTFVQKPLKYAGFGVFPINIQSFSSMITTAWSLFNLMRSYSSAKK